MSGRRVIVHAGFHKTGTTSAQQFLHSNGEYIWPTAALVLPWRLRNGASRAAVRYSRFETPDQMDGFKGELTKVIEALNLGAKRSLVFSDENLAGRMPGRDGQQAYGATPALMAAMVEVIIRTVGADADIQFVFTTREANSWLRSTWVHNLRNSRLTLDFKDYCALYAPASDLGAVVDAVRRAVDPYPVHDIPLENLTGNPEGPAAPIIQLLNLPEHHRAQLTGTGVANPSPNEGLAEALLDLNRSDLGDKDLPARKAALLGGG